MQLDPQLDGQLSINDILLELGQAPVVHPSPDAASEAAFLLIQSAARPCSAVRWAVQTLPRAPGRPGLPRRLIDNDDPVRRLVAIRPATPMGR